MAAPWNFRGANLIVPDPSTLPGTYQLFGEPPALGISNSSAGTSGNRYPKSTNMEAAPFTTDDIGPILDILSRCPEEISFSRVFKQHPELGTCWFDSFLMMVLENSGIKPFILPFVEVALQTFLANGIDDLGYSSPIDKTPEELARNKLFHGENAEIDPKNLRIDHKVKLLAHVFHVITGSPDTITMYQWNFFAYIIQKYILLAYLFLKTRPINPRLQARRGSINARGSKCLHGCLRQTIGARGCGATDRSIEDVLVSFSNLLLFITKGEFTIVPFIPKDKLKRGLWAAPFPKAWIDTFSNDKTEGYYIVMNRITNVSFGHVISLYKCNDRWTLFDNQAEIIPLDSARISAVGIKSIDYKINRGDGESEAPVGAFNTSSPSPNAGPSASNVQYIITYGDGGEPEIYTTPLDVRQSRDSEYKFSERASYKLVRVAAAGGRRHAKTQRKKKRNNRSKRR